MTIEFDDLIPKQNQSVEFDDLIPKKPAKGFFSRIADAFTQDRPLADSLPPQMQVPLAALRAMGPKPSVMEGVKGEPAPFDFNTASRLARAIDDGKAPPLPLPNSLAIEQEAQRAQQAGRAEARRQFARDNPVLGGLASGSANVLAGAINAPQTAAAFVNKTFVDPVLGLAGAGPMPSPGTMPGTEYLTGAARDYSPRVGRQSMAKAWDRDQFGEWLMVNLAQQSPQIAQSVMAALVPPLRATILPAMGAQAAGSAYVDGDDPRVAVAKGFIEAGTEMLPLGAFDRVAKALAGLPEATQRSVLSAAGRKLLAVGGAVTANSATGAIEEALAQFGGNVLDRYASGKNVGLMDKVPDAAVLGAAAGGVMSTPQVAVSLMGKKEPEQAQPVVAPPPAPRIRPSAPADESALQALDQYLSGRQLASAINQDSQAFADAPPPSPVQQTVARIMGQPLPAPAPAPAPTPAPIPALGFDPAVQNPQRPMVADAAGNVRELTADELLAREQDDQRRQELGFTRDIERAAAQRAASEPAAAPSAPSDLIERLMAAGWTPPLNSAEARANPPAAPAPAPAPAPAAPTTTPAPASAPAASPVTPEQAAVAAADAMARYGRDGIDLAQGGKPFKTRAAASQARKLQPHLRVVSHPGGGYVLANKTPAQLAAQEKAAKRLRQANVGQKGQPLAAHEFIAAEGGLRQDVRSDLGIEGNPRIGNRTLYAAPGKGLTIEQATEKLQEAGYLQSDLHNDAYDLIRRSINDTPQYTPEGFERTAEAELQAQFEDYLAAQQDAAQAEDADPFDTLADVGFLEDDSDGTGFWEADQALQAEVSALAAQLEALDVDPYDVLDPIIRANPDATQDQYNELAKQALTRAVAQATQPAGNRDSGQDDGQQGQARGQDQSPAQPEEGLTSYSSDDIEQRISALEQAEAERERQARETEQKTQADAERDEFTLTGSDRPADQAAARGQADIFADKSQASRSISGQSRGPFGPILTQYRGDAQGAIKALTELQDGEAVAALSHPEVGDIDLVWGKAGTRESNGFGLAKLVKWHPEVLDDLQGIIASLRVVNRTANRVQMESETHKAAVRLEWDGAAKHWLLTAFEKKVAEGDTRTDTAAANGLEGDTARLKPGDPSVANDESPVDPPVKSGRIEDFGQKIGGARKDAWTGFKDQLGEVSDEQIATEPLSRVWPQPDYQALLDNGADPLAVAFVRAARDEIPNKPRQSWKVKRWAEQVKTLRTMATDVLNGTDSGRFTLDVLQSDRGALPSAAQHVKGRAALYQAVGHAKSLAGINLAFHNYTLYKGEKNVSMWTVEKEAAATAWSNWPVEIATGKTREEAIEAFKAKYDGLQTGPAKKQGASFDIIADRRTGTLWVGKKIGRNYAKLAGPFKSSSEARAHRDANLAELEDKLAKFKETPFERRDVNEPRVGEDMRAGQDVTPEFFANTFGFRGVEFGNWVEQGRRQKDLNDAFDALMDMAAVLGIPPKAISLNGELGLAFGARGSGGLKPAAAHYERDKVVINLTKKNGAGSLGHEWWHALDNYFSRARKQPSDYMTEASDVGLASRDRQFYYEDRGVRREMVQAFGAVLKAISNSGLKSRAEKLDAKRTKDYWSTDVEMSARAFEAFLINKLQDQNASNDYLANIVSPEAWKAAEKMGMELDDSYPYPTGDELPSVRAAFEQFFDTVQTRETDQGVMLYDIPRNADQTNTAEFKSWFGNSKVVDADGKPLVVYHGTRSDFSEVDTSNSQRLPGFWVTPDPALASTYAAEGVVNAHRYREGANVMPLYVRVERPYRFDPKKESFVVAWDNYQAGDFDGFIETGNDTQGVTTINVKTREQVKSAIGNDGSFDLDDPSIVSDIGALQRDGGLMGRMPESVRANTLARLKAIQRRLDAGRLTPEQYISEVQAVMAQIEQRNQAQAERSMAKGRERGPDWVVERLMRAKRKGELDAETVDFALWALEKNPALANDLGISLPGESRTGAAGDYNPSSRVIRLFKASANTGTAVHEILHHSERMMPPAIQAGIQREWSRAWAKAYEKADAKQREALDAMLRSNAGDMLAYKAVREAFSSGTLNYDQHYQLMNASEFWAVNATDILGKRYEARGSWIAQARQWLREMVERIKGLLGLRSDAPVLKAIKAVMEGNGERLSRGMLLDTQAVREAPGQPGQGGGAAGTPASVQSAAAPWTVPEPGAGDAFIRAIQNNKIDVKRVRDAIRAQYGRVPDRLDAYLSEELYHGKVAARVDALHTQHVEPILAKIAVAGTNAGVTLDDVNLYLHARHAPERNAAMQAINPGMQNNDALSGMSDAEAASVMAGFQASGKRQALATIARDIDQLLADVRTGLVADGLEDAGVVQAWEGAYKHYVPLQRDMGVASQQGNGRGMGFSVRGPEAKRAVGSNLEVVNILANIVTQAETAAIRAEKAEVGRVLLKMAQAYPNPDFWQVDKPPTKPRIDPNTGLVIRNAIDPMYQTADNVVMVKHYGAEHFIVFNKRSERAMAMAHAMKNLDIAPMNKILEVANKGTRFLASLLTQRNPVFWATNFARDIQGAMLNLEGTRAEGLQRQVLGNLPKAFKGMHALVRGNATGQWARYARELQEAGGTTGYMQVFGNSDLRMQALEKEVARMQQGKADPRRLARTMLEFIDDYNDIIENAVRLSVFQAARQAGVSTEQSASIAKNITVNFNRKGNLSPAVNSLYMFFNASVQGTARMLLTLATSRKAQVAVGTLTAIGFLLDVVNRAMAGEDEETGRNRYDLIPEFEKTRNWIFMNPARPGEYVKVPLPLGPHIFHNVGRLASDAIGREDKRNASEYGWGIAGLFLDAFSPLGGPQSVGQLIAPSVLDPVLQVAENKNFTGAPVYKSADQGFGKKDPKPAYTRHFESTPDVWIGASRMMSDITGGDKVKPGLIDIEPDILKHTFYTLTGGPGRTLDQAIDSAQAPTKGREFSVNRVPLASRFYGTNDDVQRERAYYDDRKHAADAKTQFDYFMKSGRPELAREVAKKLGDGDEMAGRRKMAQFNAADKQVRAINGQIRRELQRENPDPQAQAEQLKTLRERRVKVMSGAVNDED